MKAIFNSVGSNYDLSFALRALFAYGETAENKLQKYLMDRYDGEVSLFYKGREAIEQALSNAQLIKGSSIIVSGYTCAVVPKAVLDAGYIPRYADVEDNTFHFGVHEVEKICESHKDVGAIIVQHTLGIPCDIFPIETFCKKHNILLIEDLAHSAGAYYADGREVGTVGDATILSFSQDKILDAISGGALIIRNTKKFFPVPSPYKSVSFFEQFRDRMYPILTVLVRSFYHLGIGKVLHGFLRRIHFLCLPIYSLDKIPPRALPSWYAELALFRFKSLEQEIKRRQALAEKYKDITGISSSYGTALRVPVLVQNRDSLIEHMAKNKIYISDIWYDVPVSPKRYWDLFKKDVMCPKASTLAEEMINFPTHQTLSEKDVLRIISVFKSWKNTHSKK